MKLLIVTQSVDREDPVLGFFHEWIAALASSFEHVSVICLREGLHDFPANVSVYSLGKEEGPKSRFMYALRFLYLVWKQRSSYDRVFVHMNQEYILIAGLLWKLLGKPIYMWRNHYAGTVFTDIAAAFCTKVFCTSQHSYTAHYAKTVIMPVGVETALFTYSGAISREPRSLLFLARMSPSKRPDLFIEALGLLLEKGVSFVASMYGSPLEADRAYYESLKVRAEQLGLHDRVWFFPGVTHDSTPQLYQRFEISVNCSQSGMFDKTLFEACASGTLVATSSKDFAKLAGDECSFKEGDAESLAVCLQELLEKTPDGKADVTARLKTLAEKESLTMLAASLTHELQ